MKISITRIFMMSLGMLIMFMVYQQPTQAEEAEPVVEQPVVEQPVTLQTLVDELSQSSFRKKQQAAEQIAEFDDERVLPLLKKLLDGDVYYRKEDKKPVYVQEQEEGYLISDVLIAEPLGVVDKFDIKKVTLNNQLRKTLRTLIAGLKLKSKDAQVRLEAVKQLLEKVDDDAAEKIRLALVKETDKEVIEHIQLALAMVDVQQDDKAIKIAALHRLGESLLPQARNQVLAALNEQKESEQPDKEILQAARSALSDIDSKRKIYSFIETTFFGLSLGSVLLLIAVGLAITFGVMGVINMAHGELMMLGAYTTYVVQQAFPSLIDYSIFMAIPLAFIVSGVVGIIIERGVIRHLYGRPLETLLATFGISLILQQLVRSIFSPLNRAVETPSWMSGSLEINAAFSLTYNRLYILVFALLVFVGLLLVLKKTSLGLQVRAVSQDRNMAKAMGIRTEWVDALTFGLGSGIAGVAGVALSQLTNVGPNLGQAYIVDSFMVVVFGGVGNLWGTLVGAMSLGVGNKFLEPWTGAVLAKILILVFIILFIQKKPRGLFPQKGRAAEN